MEINHNINKKCDTAQAPQSTWFSEISGSHGGEYEDDCLLGRYAVLPGKN
jgi:hypothetical protein